PDMVARLDPHRFRGGRHNSKRPAAKKGFWQIDPTPPRPAIPARHPLSPPLAIPSPAIEVVDPVPSPDGHQIAFVSQNQVWMMTADGTRPTALTRFDPESFPYSCLTPAWTRL